MTIVALLLASVAFVLLGLATETHHRRRFGRGSQPKQRRLLRGGGWLALLASVLPAMLACGWIFGPILWAGAVMAGAAIAFVILNFAPLRSDTRP